MMSIWLSRQLNPDTWQGSRMNDLDLRKLRVLRELDRRETVSAVAEALHLTPSAVSQQLASLGRELGVQLTEPVGRRLRLTGAARVVLEYTEQIFAQVEQLNADLAAYQDGEVGEVSITSFATVLSSLVLPAVARLKKDRPRLRTVLAEIDPPLSYNKLARGETDVVIGVDSVAAGVIDSRFHKVALMKDVFEVALPKDHPLADAPDVRLIDLAKEAWIFPTVGMCQEIPLAACTAAGFTPQATHVMGNWDVTFSAVGMGMGICLVPRLSRPTERLDVVIRPVREAPVRLVFAVVRDGSQKAPEMTAVLAALKDAAHAVTTDIRGSGAGAALV